MNLKFEATRIKSISSQIVAELNIIKGSRKTILIANQSLKLFFSELINLMRISFVSQL